MADRRLVVNQKGSNAQVELQADSQGNLYVTLPDGTVLDVVSTPPRETDKYGIQAISEDATYKYFFFEDDDANWYILRKHKANSVFDYAKGTGGYSSVYDSPATGPTGSPTWGGRGTIF